MGVLAGFPTSEEEDAALLESGQVTDWRAHTIVHFRMMRKRVSTQADWCLRRHLDLKNCSLT